jgi:hypothetical protein
MEHIANTRSTVKGRFPTGARTFRRRRLVPDKGRLRIAPLTPRGARRDRAPRAGEGVAQGSGVADVGLDEGEAGTGRDGLEGGQVTGMGELAHHADMCPTPGEALAGDRRADGAGGR